MDNLDAAQVRELIEEARDPYALPAWRAQIGRYLFPRIDANFSVRWRIALGLPCWCGRRRWPWDCRFQHGDRHHARHPDNLAYAMHCNACYGREESK